MNDLIGTKKLATQFLNLHKQNKLFLLPNIWNIGSAYVFEQRGFQAITTSSAGIAYDLGYPDGEDIAFSDLLEVVKKITSRVAIPVSVDFERGYADSPQVVKENAQKLILAGAVGCNIEDGLPNSELNSLENQIEKIEALVELKKEFEIDFVINARTCAYWLNVADEEPKLEIAIERGNAYAAAGADRIFIPGTFSKTVIQKLTSEISAPINIILNAMVNDFDELERLGVRRLSVGSAPVRYIYNEMINIAENLAKYDFSSLMKNPFSYAKANVFF